MMLAGIPVRDQDVLELALLLRKAGVEATAETLERAYDLETKVLALTIPEREQMIRALDDPPENLAELRGVLLRARGARARWTRVTGAGTPVSRSQMRTFPGHARKGVADPLSGR
jgi:hypothetical protein